MKAQNNLAELLAVVEKIRSEKYPDLPKEIIESILLSEFEHQDNRSEAMISCRKIINDYLSSFSKREGE